MARNDYEPSPTISCRIKFISFLKYLIFLKRILRINRTMWCLFFNHCWRLWWSSDSCCVLCLLLGVFKYPMQNSATKLLLAGLYDPYVAEAKYQHSSFWILFTCFVAEAGLNEFCHFSMNKYISQSFIRTPALLKLHFSCSPIGTCAIHT